MKNYKIAVLAGDGIGPEVMDQALKVLDVVSEKFNFSISTDFLYKKGHTISIHHKKYIGRCFEMLFFEDSSSLRQAPSPPNSSILMPAKKFENYKRTVKDFIQKFSIFNFHYLKFGRHHHC